MIRKVFLILFFYSFSLYSNEGITYEQREIDGPIILHLLHIDPNKATFYIASASNDRMHIEPLPRLVENHHALCGVNGGFFAGREPSPGQAEGFLKIDGKWHGFTNKRRSGFAFSKCLQNTLFDRIQVDTTIQIGDKVFSIDGINRKREDSQTILYNSHFHTHTPTGSSRLEITIENDRVISIEQNKGGSPIPKNGYVLATDRDLGVKKGDQVTFQYNTTSEIEKNSPWDTYENVIGGTPLLIKDKALLHDFEVENLAPSFVNSPHARTVIGTLEDGTFLFLVVEKSSKSKGATLYKLLDIVQELKYTNALNLDGGCSATMIYNKKVVNEKIKHHVHVPDHLVGDGFIIIPKASL